MYLNKTSSNKSIKQMRHMTKYILVLLMIPMMASAQQDPQFTHYMYNTIYVNPAYAGSRDALTVGLLHRNQWIGLDGAPTSQTFYLHTPLRNKSLNVGFSAVNDRIGPITQTMFYGDFAYRFNLTENIRWSFGLKGGVKLFQPRISDLNTTQPDDPNITGNGLENSVLPNIGFGTYLNSDKWYVGIGIPKMIESNIPTVDGETRDVTDKRHYFFIGGLILPVSNSIKLKPTTQFKVVENAPSSLDVTVEALFNDRFSIGVAHRIQDSFSVLAGFNVNEQFRAGVSWDFTTSELNQVNNGSLEFMLMYDFLFKDSKLKSPRYF